LTCADIGQFNWGHNEFISYRTCIEYCDGRLVSGTNRSATVGQMERDEQGANTLTRWVRGFKSSADDRQLCCLSLDRCRRVWGWTAPLRPLALFTVSIILGGVGHAVDWAGHVHPTLPEVVTVSFYGRGERVRG